MRQIWRQCMGQIAEGLTRRYVPIESADTLSTLPMCAEEIRPADQLPGL